MTLEEASNAMEESESESESDNSNEECSSSKKRKLPKTKWPGAYLFGLQLQQIKEIREAKDHVCYLKPFDDLSESTQKLRVKKLGTMVYKNLQTEIKSIFYNGDRVILNQLAFTVNDIPFKILFNKPEKVSEDLRIQSIVQAMDCTHISRSAYRALSRIGHDLPREWAVSAMKKAIMNDIRKLIWIKTFRPQCILECRTPFQ